MIATRQGLIEIICDSFSKERQEAETLADSLIGLVGDYGQVLAKSEEKGGEGPIALPESLLPDSKERIKEATKLVFLACPDKEIRNSLRLGYSSLATFVSDEKVKEAAKIDSLSSSADAKALASEVQETAKIVEQVGELDEEFDNWLKELIRKAEDSST